MGFDDRSLIMDVVGNLFKSINDTGMPIAKIAIVIVILVITHVLRHFAIGIIIKKIDKLASQNNIKLNQEWIGILKPLLNSLILVAALWSVKEILADIIGVQLNLIVTNLINLVFLFVVASAIYKASSIVGKIVAKVILHTGTDLDDLFKPLLPKIFQAIAIAGIIIKFSEMFLGQSASALVGLLGGAGITLGLLFKDIVYDWFCTIIIYLDKVYQEGDWMRITGISGSVRAIKIGFRTTTLHIVDGASIIKMPNSKMISGIVENWSQNSNKESRLGINLILKIDNISAKQTAQICDRLQEIPKSINGCYEFCRIRFSKIEFNARTIEILAFVNDEKLYFIAERQLNLAILELLEDEKINFLSVQLQVEVSDRHSNHRLHN